MAGRCTDCGAICRERAWDGNFYCDKCWSSWETSSKPQQDNWACQAKDAHLARVREESAKKAQEVARAQSEKEAKKARDMSAKTEAYREARRQAEAELAAGPSPLEGSASAASEARVPVAFWGICDLKFDPRLPERDRIKVLELGDGRASRFSHHGAAIKERFEGIYCMDVHPLKSGVMVDNKKFTHDAFLDCGFGDLRPAQFAYPRRYDKELAGRIRRDLDVPDGGAVVLKLVNRARGAGVLVCPVDELDSALVRLLNPPVRLIDWLEQHAPIALDEDRSQDVVAEQKLHYWSNESPVFVVEELVHSLPVALPPPEGDIAGDEARDGSEGDLFDGTLRVAFALLRTGAAEEDVLAIEWLGGYWKLPPCRSAAADSGDGDGGSAGGVASGGGRGVCGSLEEARACLVSSFNTEDKRTAPVAREHLLEVYAALTPALPRLFERKTMGVRDLAFSYPDDPNFRAFAMTRCSAALRSSGDWRKCNYVLEQAKKAVKFRGTRDANDMPERCVLSYIQRSMGVNFAIYGDWAKALSCWQDALRIMATNASAYYLHGIALQEQLRWSEAVDFHLKAFALDPDFRSPLMALGECWTHLGKYKKAKQACLLCLRLQPNAPVAQFNMGQAIYHQLRSQSFEGSEEREATAALRDRAKDALEAARAGIPSAWTEVEEQLLQYFECQPPRCDLLPMQQVRSWKAYGWRP